MRDVGCPGMDGFHGFVISGAGVAEGYHHVGFAPDLADECYASGHLGCHGDDFNNVLMLEHQVGFGSQYMLGRLGAFSLRVDERPLCVAA